jgi:hypothetical protein
MKYFEFGAIIVDSLKATQLAFIIKDYADGFN